MIKKTCSNFPYPILGRRHKVLFCLISPYYHVFFWCQQSSQISIFLFIAPYHIQQCCTFAPKFSSAEILSFCLRPLKRTTPTPSWDLYSLFPFLLLFYFYSISHTHSLTHTHTQTHTLTHKHTHTRTYTHTDTQTHTYNGTYTYRHTHTELYWNEQKQNQGYFL